MQCLWVHQKTVFRSAGTTAAGGTMSSGPRGTRPVAQETNLPSDPRYHNLCRSTGADKNEGGAILDKPLNHPARATGLFREPLPDPFGFSSRGR